MTVVPTTVRTTGVTKHYRGVAALDEVSIELTENTIHGLLGRNGAGKTTLMRILTGQAFATGGTVEVFGLQPCENAQVLSRVCFIQESQRYPDRFRVRHALRAAELLYPNWDNAFAASLLAEFAVPAGRVIRKLSRGQLSAVGVIIGLASRAPLTLFDEPYLGLDAVARQLFYDRLLADYAEHPRTVVLSTHLIDEVSDLIEHVVLLDRGRVLIDADAESLRGQAVTVTGPAEAVERYAAGYDELHRERLGGSLRVTLTGTQDHRAQDHRAAGLDFEPVSLQQLVIRATQNNATQNNSRPVAAGKESR
jgi:ABC-2 type transport system ATP-binding protein